MPTHTQTMLEPVSTEAGMGTSSTSMAQTCFPASPIYMGELTDAERTEQFQALCLSGEVNDGGHTFGTFNRDYVDAPNLSEVETGGGVLPASPYVPNPVSPGEGSVNPSDQAEPPEGFGQTPSSTPFVGVGALESPKATSEKTARHTLGDYKLGKGVGS